MPQLRLAANYIPGIPFVNYGHLQLVYVDDSGFQLEMEVQSEWNRIGGHWVFEPLDDEVDGLRDHTDRDYTPNYGVEGQYEFVTLLAGNEADGTWDLLKQVHIQFAAARDGNRFEYDQYYNSNTYVNTLLSIIGIDLQQYIGVVEPAVLTGGFPGAVRNALTDTDYPNDAIDLTLEGGEGADTINTGNGSDILSGKGGDDLLSGGGGRPAGSPDWIEALERTTGRSLTPNKRGRKSRIIR